MLFKDWRLLMKEEVFVGVDVCKAWLDVARTPAPQANSTPLELSARVDNDDGGRTRLVGELVRLQPTLVVLELKPRENP